MRLTIIMILTGCLLSSLVKSQESGKSISTSRYFGLNTPGETPEVFAPGIVSTDAYNHASISMSPDGDEIYWASEDESDGIRHIWYSVFRNGQWCDPAIASFTKELNGDCPMLSPDGSKLYFLSNRPLPQGDNTKRERVWYVERNGKAWSEPIALPPIINASHLHWQVSVDRDQNLYFGSERAGSKGKDDIFMAKFSNGKYIEVVSISEAINTVYHESTPFISQDGSYLLFVRNDYTERSIPGGFYISFRNADGSWRKAIYMGASIDASACPYVSPDGKFLFYKKDGKDFKNVYWVSASMINKLQQESLNNNDL